ncbi:MAG: succinylglutamate desuccinylase/aspartoacylase family protein [Bacteroidales bacterium]|nr:succinylglutamate desuccinylase/aspartoacylase family protein [Bacteroidales bacterium]
MNTKALFAALFMMLSSGVAYSQQSQLVTDKFYSAPSGVVFSTPSFLHPEGGHATYAQVMEWIESRAKDSRVDLSFIGKSTNGYDIPLLKVSDPSMGKPSKKVKVFLQGVLHGNEPAGTEGILATLDYLLKDTEGQKILSSVDVYMIPMANIDGYMADTRASADKYDLNRDQSKLTDRVSIILKKAFMEIDPDVALDLHEFNPFKADFKEVGGAIYYDALFLPTGHPNVDKGIRDAVIDYIRKPAEEAFDKVGYTHYTYFTPAKTDGKLTLVCGARSPQSSSTSWSLSNAISILVEIRGIGMGRQCFERRTNTAFILSKAVLQKAASNPSEIKKIVARANKNTIKAKAPVAALFHSNIYPGKATFLDLEKAQTVEADVLIKDALDYTMDIQRARPKAYAIDASETKAIENLRTLGLEVEILKESKTFSTESYTVTEDVVADKVWEKINTRTVSVDVVKGSRTFDKGTAIVWMNQQNANIAVSVLEPEAENGFVTFRVVEARKGQTLPICRIVK